MKLDTSKRKKFRVSNKLKKVASKDRFRLSISRSLKNISAQIIDDSKKITLLSASSLEKDVKSAGKWNGRDDPEEGADEIQRSYTPTSSEADLGRADLVINVYEGGKIDRFPDGGKMSQYFGRLKVGDAISLKGPTGSIEYLGRGNWQYAKRQIKGMSHVGMLAGGTGITPMYQIVQEALRDTSDKTKFSLIFANQTLEDILLLPELNDLAQQHPDRFTVHYTLDRPEPEWEGSTGFITAEMISAHLPPPAASTLIVMCGPPPMIKFACKQNLDALGYDKKLRLAF